MQIVIELDEKLYTTTKSLPDFMCGTLQTAIKNGVPLPEGHGKLIDASYLLNLLKCEEYENCTWKNCSDCNQEKCIRKHHILDAPAVIEADKEMEGIL